MSPQVSRWGVGQDSQQAGRNDQGNDEMGIRTDLCKYIKTQSDQSLLTQNKTGKPKSSGEGIEKYNPKETASKHWSNCTQNVALCCTAKAEKGADE